MMLMLMNCTDLQSCYSLNQMTHEIQSKQTSKIWLQECVTIKPSVRATEKTLHSP